MRKLLLFIGAVIFMCRFLVCARVSVICMKISIRICVVWLLVFFLTMHNSLFSILFFAVCPVVECCTGLDWFSFYNMFMLLYVVYLYHLEYWVVGVDVYVVHLQSVFTHLMYSILLQCVQMFSFPLCF
jgi:hypothetical protein